MSQPHRLILASAVAGCVALGAGPAASQLQMHEAIGQAAQMNVRCLGLPTDGVNVKRKAKSSDDLFQQYLAASLSGDQATLAKIFRYEDGGWRGLDGVVRRGGPQDPIPVFEKADSPIDSSQFSRQAIVIALAWTGSRAIWRGPAPGPASSSPKIVDYVVDIDADKMFGKFRIWRVTLSEVGTAAPLPSKICDLSELPSVWAPAAP